MNNEIVRKVGALHDMRIEDEHISAVLGGKEIILPEEIKTTIEDCHANAIGYEMLAESQMKRKPN